MSDEEEFVTQQYLAIFGRPPDEEGLQHYATELKNGTLERAQLTGILRSSNEYKERIATIKENKDIFELVKKTYLEILKRPADIGGLAHYVKDISEGRVKEDELAGRLMDSDEYRQNFGERKGQVVFCQGTYEERMPQTKECIRRVKPGKHVDRAVIIVDETVTNESKKWLIDHGCEVHVEKWVDSMVKMRNAYLSKLNDGDLCVVSDPDELFCENLCADFHTINDPAAKNGYGLLLVASHDVTTDLDGTVHRNISGFHKNLIYRYRPGVNYSGIGEIKEVHEVLNLPEGTNTWTLPDQYYYEHLKTEEEVLERSFRNVYMAGGGLNSGTKNPHWEPLRGITKRLGLNNWTGVRAYLRKGKIDKSLLDWIRNAKNLKGTDYLNETNQCYNYYKAIHPDEIGE